MTGAYEVIVKNRRLQYKFTIYRNITILKGDSATGKTTLIDMIQSYQETKNPAYLQENEIKMIMKEVPVFREEV